MNLKPPKQIYQIKVTLKYIRPPIWRRIQVPANITLAKLHDILQIAMGWEGYHLHLFSIGEADYGDPQDDETGFHSILSEKRYRLNQVIPGEGTRFTYEYDFGDSWDHELLVEKILPPEPGAAYPRCLKGKRACPPEDVGGVWGYAGFLEAIQDPDHPEHEEMLDWIGGEFDPEEFDLDLVNRALRNMGKPAKGLEVELESLEPGEQEIDHLFPNLRSWIEHITQDQVDTLASLPVRRDMVNLLTYLRDQRVTGTPSTGNFPLKAVREIAGQLTTPPVLDEMVDGHVYRLRSEYDVWPVYFLHMLAFVCGLVEGGPGRRWKLTQTGEYFLASVPPAQVWIMFATWFLQMNWVVAYNFQGIGEYLPEGFKEATLARLLKLPVGEWAPFEPFADDLIQAGRLTWTSSDPTYHRMSLHGGVEWMVINIMKTFGVIESKYREEPAGAGSLPRLDAIRLTEIGRTLLETLKATP